MKKRKVHKCECYMGLSTPIYRLACGRMMNDWHCSVRTWRGVTCKRCLAKRKERPDER